MPQHPQASQTAAAGSTWRATAQPYQRADTWRSVWQVASSFIPYLLLLKLSDEERRELVSLRALRAEYRRG